MTLAEFRELTAHLDGDLEFYCAGADIGLLWHNDAAVSIDDDGCYPLDEDEDATVLYRDGSVQVYDIDYIVHRERELATC